MISFEIFKNRMKTLSGAFMQQEVAQQQRETCASTSPGGPLYLSQYACVAIVVTGGLPESSGP